MAKHRRCRKHNWRIHSGIHGNYDHNWSWWVDCCTKCDFKMLRVRLPRNHSYKSLQTALYLSKKWADEAYNMSFPLYAETIVWKDR